MIHEIAALFIAAGNSIHHSMACIDGSDVHIALVVDEGSGLLDTTTDGDVRRAILAGVDMDSSVSVL